MARTRNRWGWGFEDATVSAQEARAAAPGVGDALGFDLPGDVEDPVPLEAVRLPAPRLEVPAGLRAWCTADIAERAAHAYGKSYLDAVRALRGRYDHAPDVVARPRDEADVEALLAWAADAGAAVIPYGGGTSVVGGIEARIPDRFAGAVTVDLSALDALHEVDDVSRASRSTPRASRARRTAGRSAGSGRAQPAAVRARGRSRPRRCAPRAKRRRPRAARRGR